MNFDSVCKNLHFIDFSRIYFYVAARPAKKHVFRKRSPPYSFFISVAKLNNRASGVRTDDKNKQKKQYQYFI
jgi:hypothetical protein